MNQLLLRVITEQDFSFSSGALANDPSLWIYFTQDFSVAPGFDNVAPGNENGSDCQFC